LFVQLQPSQVTAPEILQILDNLASISIVDFPCPQTPDFAGGLMPRLVVVLLLLLSAAAWAASVPKTLHDFELPGVANDGNSLYSSLTFDTAGNAYGTTVSGGRFNAGVVYELSPTSSGPWKETILYNFKGGTKDGSGSHATPVFDVAGNLYGTTVGGGLKGKSCAAGCGVVFKLTPSTNGGPWTETILHQFTGGSDGGTAFAGVIIDSAGNLYGATIGGGSKGLGTVYELSPSGSTWQETVLHNFTGKPDGSTPYAPLVFDSAGNLYGTTYAGGASNQGTVYQLTQAGGTWTEQVLCSFKGGTDGNDPFAPVTLDQAGNVYGTTQAGGTASVGTAFELDAANGWNKTILHQFLGLSAGDGANPNSLVFDKSGNLFGTSVGGGKFNPGTIFRLSPKPAGGWKETVLYSFTGGNDGAYPSAGPTIDAAGNLFGTTLWGGPAGDTVGGVAFEFIP
jgi:uncharacterized repeat protein (TIGR03803 family)